MKKICLEGVVGWDITATSVEQQLNDANGEDITVEANSPGGSVFEGLKIFNLLKNYTGKVNIHLMGLAASMMSYIAMVPGARVTCEANNVFMIHNVWGMAAGDYREMAKSAKVFDGLTGLLAGAYVAKTCKSMGTIRGLMDEETYLFGEEAVAAGFVDECCPIPPNKDQAVADPPIPPNKDQMVAQARLNVAGCLAKMKSDAPEAKELDKIAAIIQVSGRTGPQGSPTSPPGTAGNQNKEELSMTLQEFLAQNSAARAEHEALIASAKKAGGAEVMARVEGAMPVITGSVYPESVKAMAVQAVKGEVSSDMLRGALILADGQIEAAKSEAAKLEGGKDTPPNQPDFAADQSTGVLNTAEEIDKALAAKKGGK